jgi:hypothetical protein
MHLAPIDVSRVPRYRRIPPASPGRPQGAYAEAIAFEAPPEEAARKPLNWFVVAFLAWEMSQIAIGVYYGVKLALVIT